MQSETIIGIIGGMGPAATIRFQQRILDATPASKDQDHLRVLCFNDSQIPDRTTSLKTDNGHSYVEAVVEAGNRLEQAGATILVMPCITAHARFDDIAANLSVPMINIVDLTLESLRKDRQNSGVGIMATDGTIDHQIFQKHDLVNEFRWVTPLEVEQDALMKALYRIKGGEIDQAKYQILDVAHSLIKQGAQTIILGCTELSLVRTFLEDNDIPVIDPMEVAARYLVEQADRS